jgi:hydroxycarboxylate dehydrogenase B
MSPVICSAGRLGSIVRGIFEAAGSSAREAGLIADHLVEANLKGHDSHGVGMIPTYVRNARSGELRLNQELSIVLDTGSLLVCDAGRGAGQAVAHDALDLAIDRARNGGSCLLALRNSHHLGRIGHWAEQCARANLVSIHFVNVVSEPAVAPFGGTVARVGTNPFAVGLPRSDAEPIIVDFATSKWAVGKVRVAHNEGRAVPPDTLLDAFGEPSTDPGVLFAEPKGALLTFGDHKGWGLSLACELLGGALTGGKTQAGPKSRDAIVNSMFSVLVSPKQLGTLDNFNAETKAFLDWAQSQQDLVSPIRVAGEPERQIKQRREQDGIPIDPVTWDEVCKAGEEVGFRVVL